MSNDKKKALGLFILVKGLKACTLPLVTKHALIFEDGLFDNVNSLFGVKMDVDIDGSDEEAVNSFFSEFSYHCENEFNLSDSKMDDIYLRSNNVF